MVESALFELTRPAMKGERVLHLRRVPRDTQRSVDALRPGQSVYIGLTEDQMYRFSNLISKPIQWAVIDAVTEGAVRLTWPLWSEAAEGESVLRPRHWIHQYESLA